MTSMRVPKGRCEKWTNTSKMIAWIIMLIKIQDHDLSIPVNNTNAVERLQSRAKIKAQLPETRSN